MVKVTVTTSAVSLPIGNNARPLLQNLGPGVVYFGPDLSVSANNGFKLLPGMGYEFPNTLREMDAWASVCVVSDATADLRYGSVG